jgi:hypothetical protein
MARFCHFYPGLTPQAFWDLDVLEYRALARHMERVHEAEQEALTRARQQRLRGRRR